VKVWTSSTSPHVATLPCEIWNRKCMWTQFQLLMWTTKLPLHASNYIDSFIKCSGESFMSEHVFEVSTTSIHTMISDGHATGQSQCWWCPGQRQTKFASSVSAVDDVMNLCFIHTLLYTHCCITPWISKFKVRDDPGPLWWSCDTSAAIIFVISHCNVTFSEFLLSQGSAATLIAWGGWSAYLRVTRLVYF